VLVADVGQVCVDLSDVGGAEVMAFEFGMQVGQRLPGLGEDVAGRVASRIDAKLPGDEQQACGSPERRVGRMAWE
jgi:hypothetical protein